MARAAPKYDLISIDDLAEVVEGDPRLKSVKKDHTVPNVGDTVVFNDSGLQQVFGHARGLAHMRTLRMKITHVGDTSLTYPDPTFPVKVDNKDIDFFLIDSTCFDIVECGS